MGYLNQARLVFGLGTLVTVAVLIVACSQSSTPTAQVSPEVPVQEEDEATPGKPSAPLRFSGDCAIMIQGVGMKSDDGISIYGSCLLPENACIVTQLLDHGEVVPWWPANACATIEDSHWHIDVPLESDNLTAKGYRVHAWERGNSAVTPARYPFSIEVGEGSSLLAVPPSLPEPASPSVNGSISGLLNDDRAAVRVCSQEDMADGSGGERTNGLWEMVITRNSIGIKYYTVTAEAEGYSSQPSHYSIATDCKTAYILRDDKIGEEAADLDFKFIPNHK